MSNLNQFMGSEPVGSIRQSVIDLEAESNGQWMLANNRSLLRADYPAVESYYPDGTYTPTLRTLAAVPGSTAPAADSVNFLVAGPVGTSPLQASADGATWVKSASWAASTAFRNIIVAGARWIVAPYTGETQPYVMATGGTATDLVNKANWTVTTGASVTSGHNSLAYSPTLGRTVLIVAYAAQSYYLNDGSTAWTAMTGGSATQNNNVVWTGQKFIKTENAASSTRYQESSDGITWTDSFFPLFNTLVNSNSVGTIASNGAGVVLIRVSGIAAGSTNYSYGIGFLRTADHGATWSFISTETLQLFLSSGVYCLNSVFYSTGLFGVAASVDGVTWVVINPLNGIANTSLLCKILGYKSGVYLTFNGATAAATFTADSTTFRLPGLYNVNYSDAGVMAIDGNYYIKVK